MLSLYFYLPKMCAYVVCVHVAFVNAWSIKHYNIRNGYLY